MPQPYPQTMYLPTPEEIAAVCREIRSEWDAETEWQRRTASPGLPDVRERVADDPEEGLTAEAGIGNAAHP